MNNIKLNKIISKYLKSKYIRDISFNGMQIEGKKKIKNIITCVTINKYIIKKTILNKYDAIIAHHGILWNNSIPNIIGILKKRIHKIILNKINIYSWHLPLDIHPKIGNNIQIAKKNYINIKKLPNKNFPVLIGKIKNKKKIYNLIKNKNIYFYKSIKKSIYKIGICSGNGSKFLEKSILDYNIDTYITGELSEKDFYIFKEYDINIIILKHYISEIYGIKSLGKWIKNKLNLNVTFINTFKEYEIFFYKNK